MTTHETDGEVTYKRFKIECRSCSESDTRNLSFEIRESRGVRRVVLCCESCDHVDDIKEVGDFNMEALHQYGEKCRAEEREKSTEYVDKMTKYVADLQSQCVGQIAEATERAAKIVCPNDECLGGCDQEHHADNCRYELASKIRRNDGAK